MKNFNDELHRSIIVIVKDYLKVVGLGLNIGHGIVPPDWCHFGVSRRIAGLLQSKSPSKKPWLHPRFRRK